MGVKLDLLWWSFCKVYKNLILCCTLETNMLHVHYTTVKKGFDAKDEMKKRRERYKNTQTYAFNRSKM